MSKLALEQGAINLSQGYPDFPVSSELIKLIHDNLTAGNNQYAPMPGSIELRTAIAKVVASTYGRQTNPETEVIITAGGTEALFSAIAAFVDQGDEVIMFDPSYDSYDPAVRLNGGVPVHINLMAPEFSIPWDEVKARINSKTKVIMINTPHNPTGAVLTGEDLKMLETIATEHKIVVISDEVYERLIYEGKRHESVLRYPGLAGRSVAVFSFGKTFHATGWKIGYTVASPELTTEIRKTHQFITFSVNTPIQLAFATYLAEPEHYETLGAFYQQKRDFFLQQIEGSSFKPMKSYGSYFQLLSYAGMSKKNEKDMAEWMTRELKVASIPVSVFYKDGTDQKLLRFCFAKKEETLEKAGAILRKL